MYFGFNHTFNRGVEKRNIFLDEKDYLRGVHDLYEFNDAKTVLNFGRRLKERENQYEGNRISISEISNKKREPLLDLFSWCLMPNHKHLFSRPRYKDGLAKFHQKFGIGYTNYFNLKYNRDGVLFQGKHKKVEVTNDAQAAHLVCYIHSNPLELWKPNWKEKGLTELELQNALEFLEKKYRWSSHQDYLSIKNFPSLINNEFLFKFFGGHQGYRKFFLDWLKQYDKNIKLIQKITLE